MGYLIAGRLKESGSPVKSKHPAILPINHHISALVLHKIHLELKHSGRNHILSKLREKCRQHKKVGEQKMSSLSEDHVTSDESPITREGVDYFGPFEVKVLWLYIYKSSCAVHLEVACSLDTSSCLLML